MDPMLEVSADVGNSGEALELRLVSVDDRAEAVCFPLKDCRYFPPKVEAACFPLKDCRYFPPNVGDEGELELNLVTSDVYTACAPVKTCPPREGCNPTTSCAPTTGCYPGAGYSGEVGEVDQLDGLCNPPNCDPLCNPYSA